MFYTIDKNRGTTIDVARDKLRERFGYDEDGVVFIIDMANRQLSVYCNAHMFDVVSKNKTDTIVSNVYRMASREQYYACASEVFKEVAITLEGGKIAAPMKLASNILLALMIGLLIAYFIVKAFSTVPKPSEQELLAAIQLQQSLLNYSKQFTHQTRRYDPPSSSSSGGGGVL